jgi:hypothetical protein
MSVKQLTYLDALLDSVAACFTPDVARRVAGLKVEPGIQARIDELAEKANEGLLTPQERAEYEEFVEAADLIAILQAKARRLLAEQDS